MSHNPALRKAAILVSLLDSRSADALLEPMGEELASQVRQAVMDLDEISDREQEEVLAEFFGHDAPLDPADGGVEIELSSQPWPQKAAAPLAEAPASHASAPSFEFLADLAPEAIADVLSAEQPQTIAVVLVHLPPEVAGRILERLNPALAIESLSRMAWLTIPAAEVLADLELELRRRLAPAARRSATSPASLAGVQAILASLPGHSRTQWIDRLAQHDEQLALRLDVASHFPREAALAADHRAEVQPPLGRSTPALSPPLMEFEDLLLLSDRDLACLANAAREPILALALLDADERLTRRILALLPSGSAGKLRGRLTNPGPLRLREIDEAQRQLADLARELASGGEIALPQSRHFAAAA